MAALNLANYAFAGRAPGGDLSALNYSGSTTANGNPFKSNSQEYGQYDQYWNQANNPAPAAGQSVADIAAQLAQANAPTMNSLNATIPEIQNQYKTLENQTNAQIDPLTQKYQALLQDLQNKQGQAVGAAQTSTARDFGQRGLSVNDSAFSQALASQVNPINQNFGNLELQNQLASQSGVQALLDQIGQYGGQETAAERQVQQLIADLQSGSNKDAISMALDYFKQNQQQQQFNQSQALAQQQADFAEKNPGLTSINLGGSTVLINPLTGQVVSTFKNTAGPSSGGGSGALTQLPGLPQTTQPAANTSNQASLDQIGLNYQLNSGNNSGNAGLLPNYDFLGQDTSLFGGQSNNLGNGLNVDLSKILSGLGGKF